MTLRYLEPDTDMTLAEGLAEYRRSIPGLLDEDDLEGEAKRLFHAHDVAHVVFGCDTSIHEEAMLDTWTLFGTDIGVRAYVAYLKVPEARNVIVDIGVGHTLWQSLQALPDLVRVHKRAKRMHERWPWENHEAYLDRPLSEIRRELGIEVLRPRPHTVRARRKTSRPANAA